MGPFGSMNELHAPSALACVHTRAFDRREALVLEVVARWKDRLLDVVHLARGERYRLPSSRGDGGRSSVDARSIRFEVDERGASARLAEGVSVTIRHPDGRAEELAVDAWTIVAIEPGASVIVSTETLSFSARWVSGSRPARRATIFDRSFAATVAGVLLCFVCYGAALRSLRGPRSELLASPNDDQQEQTLRRFVERQRQWSVTDTNFAPGVALTAQPRGAAPGPVGPSGAYEAPRRAARSAVQDRREAPQLAQRRARELIASRGIFAALAEAPIDQRETRAPEHLFGGLLSSGRDRSDAWARIQEGSSDDVADAFGFGGLGRLPIGQDAGGGGYGVGATCDMRCQLALLGYGSGRGAMLAMRRGEPTASLVDRRTRGPVVTAAPPAIEGAQISAELIRRVVRRNLGQVQHCFEQALTRISGVAGRVVVHFVINPEGAVIASRAIENSTDDRALGQCVAQAFARWSFPSPGSVVSASYPILMRTE